MVEGSGRPINDARAVRPPHTVIAECKRERLGEIITLWSEKGSSLRHGADRSGATHISSIETCAHNIALADITVLTDADRVPVKHPPKFGPTLEGQGAA